MRILHFSHFFQFFSIKITLIPFFHPHWIRNYFAVNSPHSHFVCATLTNRFLRVFHCIKVGTRVSIFDINLYLLDQMYRQRFDSIRIALMHECKHKPPKLQAHTCELNEQVLDVKIFTFLLHCSIVYGIVVIEWTTSKFNFILFFSHSTLSETQKEFIVSYHIIIENQFKFISLCSFHFV